MKSIEILKQTIIALVDLFKRPKSGARPATSVPGVGRGAVPFFTRLDLGAANSEIK